VWHGPPALLSVPRVLVNLTSASAYLRSLGHRFVEHAASSRSSSMQPRHQPREGQEGRCPPPQIAGLSTLLCIHNGSDLLREHGSDRCVACGSHGSLCSSCRAGDCCLGVGNLKTLPSSPTATGLLDDFGRLALARRLLLTGNATPCRAGQ
jgi:hypothetical protein